MGALTRHPVDGLQVARTARGAVLEAGRAGGLEAEERSALAVAVSETARRLRGRGWLALETGDGTLRAVFGGPAKTLREAADSCAQLLPDVQLADDEDDRPVLVLERSLPKDDEPAVAGALDRFSARRVTDPAGEPGAGGQTDREVRELLLRLRKRERDVERLNAELEETNRGVVALYAELDERDQRKNEFLATLAHELRNPLGVVGTALHAVRAKNSRDPEVARPLRLAERQLWHLARLVDDLLDISRIDQGKITLRRQRVDLAEVVVRSVESCGGLMRERNHHLDVNLGEESMPLNADPVRLEQVVDNLLSNAAKYTPEGGHVRVRAHRRDDHAVLRVEDDGVGIAPEMLDRVFQRFAQADETLDRSGGGLGLGLALVERLVSLHGGTVSAHSEGEGQGSRFLVELPLAAAGDERCTVADAPAEASPEEKEEERGPLSVLLVEDNNDAREMMALLLEGRGFQVATAGDGPEGVERGTGEDFDAAVVDIGLPGLDGYGVARRLRAHERSADMLLVALSGYGRPEDRDESARAGFDHHLVKPVEPDELCRVLNAGRGG